MDTSSDPFSGNEWELSKENVQPLIQGRKMAPLTAALAPSSLDQTRIHREKQEFEAAIRTYKGDDPLEVWHRYIAWMSENFPKGSKDFGTLLERCITTFKDEERYRNDERYAKVWLRYSDICKDPMDIYNYMHSQQVCSGLALFYESWALFLENSGDSKKADEVYSLGINRNAQPLDKLVKQHRAFEIRLAERISNGMQQVSLTDNSEPQRTMLGGLKPYGKKSTVGTKRTGSATMATRGGLCPVRQIPNAGASFKVFCDEDVGTIKSLPPSTGEWQMPPTEPVLKKENTQKPGKWSNAKVSQRNQLSVPFNGTSQKPNFTVHVDNDVASHPPCTPQNVSQFDKVLSVRKPEKPFVTEALSTKLLSNSGGHAQEQESKVMYCKDKIYAGTEEFSFEELRAARIFSQMRAGTYVQPVTEDPQANNVRCMYPKKEVYSLDGEFQWEEVLARRHFERLKNLKSSKSYRDVQFRNQKSGLAADELQREEPMEVGSCQKGVIEASAYRVPEATFEHYSSLTQSSTESFARRGLAFGCPPSSRVFPTDSENPNCGNKDVCRVPPLSNNQAHFTLGSGLSSAFHPARNGLHLPPNDCTSSNKSNTARIPNGRSLNISSCYDAENAHPRPLDEAVAPLIPNIHKTPLADHLSTYATSVEKDNIHTGKNNVSIFFRTPDANISGDVNSSHLTGPSPTVFTKQALEEVRNMFHGPLESERDATMGGTHHELNDSDKDFEAAFSNENTATGTSFSTGLAGFGGLGSATGFVIYEEPATDMKSEDNEAEDKENMPPKDSHQETAPRPLAGILQPSVGIPICPQEHHSEDEEEFFPDKENFPDQPVKLTHQTTEKQQNGKSNEVSLAEYPNDQTLASVSFATAARVASTPFWNGIGPPSLPNIPWSTIRPAADNNQTLNDLAVEDNAHAQSGGSFMSTPSKVLSPILERSNEDSKSTNSSQSSSASSRRGSCSAGLPPHSGVELSKIQEEPSNCHGDILPQCEEEISSVLDPFSAKVIDRCLLSVNPPVNTYEGFFQSTKEMPRIATNLAVSLGSDEVYRVERVVASGAFAKVYMARKLIDELQLDDLEMDDDSAVVLKVQSVSVEWEFYICRQLHKRLNTLGSSEETHSMFMNPPSAYLYCNSSVLVDKYNSLGTLLDMVNKYKIKQKSIEHCVAVYYTIALLRILETMHNLGIIHGDIKPDNFIVLDSDADTPNSPPLQLIDFGRSIDMTLFPPGTTFTANCYTDNFQCTEMKEGKPWTTQIDTYGVLGTIHCLVFGEYMKVFKDQKGSGRWKITKSFKRHWDGLWSTFFDSLLNSPHNGEQASIRKFRHQFENIYEADESTSIRQKRRHDILMFE